MYRWWIKLIESLVMEPVSSAIIKAATNEVTTAAKKESESFLKAVLGEPANALGGLIGDWINQRRHANLINITVEAKRRLAKAGVSPKEVPLKIIHPAIEAASLEDEPDLQNLWANLLANAADPTSTLNISAIFPDILRQLSRVEARYLDRLYTSTTEQLAPGLRNHTFNVAFRNIGSQDALISDFVIAELGNPDIQMSIEKESSDERLARMFECERQCHIAIGNFLRLGVIGTKLSLDLPPREKKREVEYLSLTEAEKLFTMNHFHLTILGAEFVRACRR